MASDADIAIVGVGCCFPGADNLEEFWRVLVNGENHVVEIPESRWNNEAYYSADKDAPGKTYVRKAGLLKNPYEWDNRFFGISDTEAARIEPQQRYVLECVHMALEDGGITKSSINGSNTGVFIGCMNDDYKMMITEDEADMTSYSATGMTTSIIAARVSYVYNLHGPCLTLDTACSSSLVAIHLGCQAIRTGDAQMAICGGVSSIISPKIFIALSKARMMSSIGQCQSFADTADGYARGEGCGVVILKRLNDAIRDKNKIWGIVRTGCNQDGHMAQPITAPSGEQQKKLLTQVYAKYDMEPASVQYIEAHGTGTPTGDPTEVNALGQFFAESRKLKHNTTQPLLIGSVKSNIGHTESAAGVAGLIKILLMMYNHKIVPSLHINENKSNINKNLNLETHGLDIALNNLNWDQNNQGHRIACVNSFGFGGSNSHAILISGSFNGSQNTDLKLGNENAFPELFCITATDAVSLEKNINAFVQDISETKENLRNISFTSMVHRDHMSSRALLHGRDAKSIAKCASEINLSADKAKRKADHNIVFVFCGVGTTWTGMCKKLMSINAFREKVKEIDTYLKPLTGWNMFEKFENNTSYDDPLLNHIAIFVTQIALTSVWRAWGIQPDVIIGQSVGEVAAACVSGIIPLSEGVRIIYQRSKILSKITGGSMMVVGNKRVSETAELCKKYENVTVAVYSSPVACTVSGNTTAIQTLKYELQKEMEMENRTYLIRELRVKCAYHSPLVEECRDELIRAIGNIQFNKSFVTPILTTVYGEVASQNHFTSAEYWAENVCKPVMFYQSVVKAAQIKPCVFLEIGPRPVLEAHIENILPESDGCLSSMRVNKEFESLCSSLHAFFKMGRHINWSAFCGTCDFQQAAIPRYRFNKSKIIRIGEKMQKVLLGLNTQEDASHLFVRRSISESGQHFEIVINAEVTPFVYDHTLSNTILVPGATYIEAAFKVGTILLNRSVTDLTTQVDFQRPVTLSTNGSVLIPMSIQLSHDTVEFSCSNNGQIVSKGSVYFAENLPPTVFDIHKIKGRCPTFRNKIENYECLQKLQFKYGPLLSLMENSWASEKECIVELVLPEGIERQLSATVFHPAVIDGVFQIFGILSSSTSAIPKGVDKVVIYGTPRRRMYAYACIEKTTPAESNVNAVLLTEMGHALLEIQNFHTRAIEEDIPKHLKYETSHIKLEALAKTNNKRNLFVLNCAGTSSRLYEVLCEEGRFKYGTSVKDINTSFIDAVLFLGVRQDTESTTKQPQSIIARYMALKEVVLQLAELKIEVPLYILTENCQLCPDQSGLQPLGSEYWGLVRALRHENLLQDIRLLDIDSATVTSEMLISLITNLDTKNAEICISPTGTYELLFKECRRAQYQKRSIAMDAATNAILSSTSWHEIVRPFYKDTVPVPNVTKGIQVGINSFALHDKRIYATSVKLSDSILHNSEDSGFAVVILEGKGTVVTNDDNDERSEDVVFCHPVIAKRPFVTVPKECTIPLLSLPFYFEGMLTMLCILIKLATEIPMNSKVIVVQGENPKGISGKFLCHQLHRRNCHTRVVAKGAIETESMELYKYDSVLILTYVTDELLKHVLCGEKMPKGIVTLSYLLTENMRTRLQLLEMKVVVVETCDVFVTDELKTSVQIVAQTVRNLHHLETKLDVNVGHMKLPFETQTLALPNDAQMYVGKNGLFHKNACYVVVGGLTGLGKLLVEYIAELGGGHIASFSRRAPSTAQSKEFKLMEVKYNCKIYFAQVDVSELKSVERGINTVQNIIDSVYIRGIFHGAGVLSDGLFINQTDESVQRVLAPKVNGSWNLHIVSDKLRLDYFVLQSSVVSVLGNSGQTSYAAANSFLDSLAAYRRSLGLCGQSINWGALSVGMAIDNSRTERMLKQQGISLLALNEIKECFLDALLCNEVQPCYVAIDWEMYSRQAAPTVNLKKIERLVSKLDRTRQSTESMATEQTDLGCLDDVQRRNKITEIVREQVCKAFVIAQEDLKNETKFGSLGVDSMSAMSFVNSVFQIIKVKLSIVQILSEESNVEAIVEHLMQNFKEQSISTGKTFSANILDDAIPFMQNTVLEEYFENKDSISLIHLVELEIKKATMTFDQWKTIFTKILKMHPQLSTHIISDKQGGYKVTMMTDFEHLDEITEVPLQQMIQQRESGIDLRKTVVFNLEKERPIKWQIGIGIDVTVLRVSIHKAISDLYALSIFFQDLANVVQSFVTNTSIRRNEDQVDIPNLMKHSLLSTWDYAEQFWSENFKSPIQPITMGKTLEKPHSDFCGVVWHTFQKSAVVKISSFLRENNVTLFQLVASLYQFLLHIETSKESVIVTTDVDMRVHVPGLSDVLARCVNVVPLICTINDTVNLKKFILQNAIFLTEIVKFGFFPTQLINANLKSHTERVNVGRHYVVLNKMDMLNDVSMSNQHYSVKVTNVTSRRFEKETSLYVLFDLDARELTFEMYFNSAICGADAGSRLMTTLLCLLDIVLNGDNRDLKTIRESVNHSSTAQLNQHHFGQISGSITQGEHRTNVSPSDAPTVSGANLERKKKEMSTNSINSQDRNVTTILVGAKFQKQTTQGWCHMVYVNLVETWDNTMDTPGLMLRWGKREKGPMKSLNLLEVRTIQLRKLDYTYNIVLKTSKRQFVLSSYSINDCEQLLQGIKSFLTRRVHIRL